MNSVVNIFSIQQKMTWTMRQTADLGTQPIQSVAERYSYMGNSATVRSRNLCLTVLAINTFTYLLRRTQDFHKFSKSGRARCPWKRKSRKEKM